MIVGPLFEGRVSEGGFVFSYLIHGMNQRGNLSGLIL